MAQGQGYDDAMEDEEGAAPVDRQIMPAAKVEYDAAGLPLIVVGDIGLALAGLAAVEVVGAGLKVQHDAVFGRKLRLVLTKKFFDQGRQVKFARTNAVVLHVKHVLACAEGKSQKGAQHKEEYMER